jgi:putative transposase
VCQRYIELNPVRAGLVAHPAAYPWSSHPHYSGGRERELITEHPVYRQLGATAAHRRAAYLELFEHALDEEIVERIRQAINTDSAFGSEAFLDQAEATLGRSVRPPARGRPLRSVTGKLL